MSEYKECDGPEDERVLRGHFSTLANPPRYGPKDIQRIHFLDPDQSCWREVGTENMANIVGSVAGGADSAQAVSVLDSATVLWLFPRAAWDADNLDTITPVLSMAIVDFADKHPLAERNDWVISASFMDGRRKLDQEPDGGKELCEVWRDRVWKLQRTAAIVRDTERLDPQQPTKNLYEIWWTFRPVLKVAREQLRGA